MDETERRIVAEKLNDFGSWGAHAQHELYRCFTVHGSGLNEKEQQYLKTTASELKEVLDRARKIKERCR